VGVYSIELDKLHEIYIYGSVFSYCYSLSQGGALCLYDANTTIENCSYLHCLSRDTIGGVICYYNKGKILIRNCLFFNNSAGGCGGAYFSDSSEITDTIFEKNNFTNCSAVGGGAIAIFSFYFSVSECIFVNCRSEGEGMLKCK
jgi:hypothetical protein